MHRITLLSTVLASLLCCAVPARADITIDGSWNDWGINPGAGKWTSSVGSRIFLEDYTGKDPWAFDGPGYGGQYFDVEALYFSRAGNQLSFAIVTGFDPDGVMHSGTTYYPGDIFFDVGSGWKSAIRLMDGKVYTNVTATPPTAFPASGPYKIRTGTYVGQADLKTSKDGSMTVYTSGASTYATHQLIEGSINLDLIGGDDRSVRIHWTMSCGNDVGEGNVPPCPEPATLALVGLGLVGVLGRRALRARS